MKIGFIGAGKVGFTLGKYLAMKKVQVTGYYSRNTERADEAARFTGSRCYEDVRELMEDSDALLLTVPDGAISEVYESIRELSIEGKMIGHCSGALSSDKAFPNIREYGAYAFSVHPLFAVSDKYEAYRELGDVFFAVEGDQEILPEIDALLSKVGLRHQLIDKSMKGTYHCAAAVASNLAVGLMDMSAAMLKRCGFSYEDALAALGALALGNVKHVFEDGPVAALTGPVERADAGTVEKHLDVLMDYPDEKEIYRLLSKRLVSLAKAKHPERDFARVEEML